MMMYVHKKKKTGNIFIEVNFVVLQFDRVAYMCVHDNIYLTTCMCVSHTRLLLCTFMFVCMIHIHVAA